jgi:hypothetical protein
MINTKVRKGEPFIIAQCGQVEHMFNADERRAFARGTALSNRSRLELTTADGRRRIEASLLNVSRGGTLMSATETPDLHTPVLIRIESPVKTDWVAAVVVRLASLGQVALSFIEPCADDFLLAAWVGLDFTLMLGSPGETWSSGNGGPG